MSQDPAAENPLDRWLKEALLDAPRAAKKYLDEHPEKQGVAVVVTYTLPDGTTFDTDPEYFMRKS